MQFHKGINLISRVFLPGIFLNFLAHCVRKVQHQSCFSLFRPLTVQKIHSTYIALCWQIQIVGGMKMIGGIHLIVHGQIGGQLTRGRILWLYVCCHICPPKKSGNRYACMSLVNFELCH